MSRVRSLIVSRVMELFWRRCLHVERENSIPQLLDPLFFLNTQSFPDAKRNYLLQVKTNELLPNDIRTTILLTLLLSCWTASCLHWMGR